MEQQAETFIESYDTAKEAWDVAFRLAEVLEKRGQTPRWRMRVKEVRGVYWVVLVQH